jgi:hypothetical protein
MPAKVRATPHGVVRNHPSSGGGRSMGAGHPLGYDRPMARGQFGAVEPAITIPFRPPTVVLASAPREGARFTLVLSSQDFRARLGDRADPVEHELVRDLFARGAKVVDVVHGEKPPRAKRDVEHNA